MQLLLKLRGRINIAARTPHVLVIMVRELRVAPHLPATQYRAVTVGPPQLKLSHSA